VGLDFLAHPFWDRYLEFEERAEQPDHIFKILERVIQIPQHQYARYFDRFRTMALSRPIDELAPADVIAQIQTELATDSAHTEKGAAEVERDLRAGIDAHHLKLFQRTQIETTKRWTYEAEIKRPYYHVLDLDEAQISNWQMYLDYEEAEGDYNRVKFLYERCLVTCANYDDFWSRYVRWTLSQQDKPQQIRDEEARNIYARACCFYVPIARHSIRLSYARFEESLGKADMAIAIHEAILMQMPGHLETIISLANTHRRQNGVDAAVDTLTTYAGSIEDDINTRGALVAELARLTWKIKGDVGAARKIFQDQQRWFPDSVKFWGDFFDFELAQPTSAADEATRSQSIRAVFNDIRYKSQLPPEMIKSLAMKYFDYLLERGDKAAVEEYVNLDREINGPASVAAKQPDPAPVATEMKDMVVDHPMGLENGDAPP
jgi:pre-mRNA-processing factor 39